MAYALGKVQSEDGPLGSLSGFRIEREDGGTGRRTGLKIQSLKRREGSIPSLRTKKKGFKMEQEVLTGKELFINLLGIMQKKHEDREEYISIVRNASRESANLITNNKYSESLISENEALTEFIIREEVISMVYWWVFDNPVESYNPPHHIDEEKKEYTFKDVFDFVDFIFEKYGNPFKNYYSNEG